MSKAVRSIYIPGAAACDTLRGRVQVALGKLDDARRAIDRVVAEFVKGWA